MENDISEKKSIGLNFGISVTPKEIVRARELVKKYGKEAGLEIIEYKFRDFTECINVYLGLRGFVRPLDAEYIIEVLMGLVEEISQEVGAGLVEEDANSSMTNYAPVVEGKDIGLYGTKKDEVYLLRSISEIVYVYANVEDMLEMEKKYDNLTRQIFLMTPTEWYEENSKLLHKDHPEREEFEIANSTAELFERKTSVKKSAKEKHGNAQ
ncbi:MAG: hypothetical protein ABEI74_01480 [Candidatus Pacearchaeota archaeon]